MKLIYVDDTGSLNFDKYFAYIRDIEANLPEGVFKYAAEDGHYNLSSHNSLHDAWLEYCAYSEPSSGERNEIRSPGVECCFLGPYHDKNLILVYKDVSSYQMNAINTEKGLGDLNVHEFYLNNDNTITHELYFINGSIIRIAFKELEYREEDIKIS